MIDKKAMYSLTYGLYIISTKDLETGKQAGCVVNTLSQVTSDPPRVSVAMNKDSYTAETIQKTRVFAATVLAQSISAQTVGLFGFQSSRKTDKFADILHKFDEQELPYLAGSIVARFSAKVVNVVDVGTHLIFIGEVVESEKISDEEPLTYTYYRQIKGGKTPPNAPSYQPESDADDKSATTAEQGSSKISWRCSVCGHVEIADELPAGYVCPICKQPREVFMLA